MQEMSDIDAGAAAEVADARDPAGADEDLASEVEIGSGTLRALWRWACYQVRNRLLHPANAYGSPALSTQRTRAQDRISSRFCVEQKG
jgi:hypothetical protein